MPLGTLLLIDVSLRLRNSDIVTAVPVLGFVTLEWLSTKIDKGMFEFSSKHMLKFALMVPIFDGGSAESAE